MLRPESEAELKPRWPQAVGAGQAGLLGSNALQPAPGRVLLAACLALAALPGHAVDVATAVTKCAAPQPSRLPAG